MTVGMHSHKDISVTVTHKHISDGDGRTGGNNVRSLRDELELKIKNQNTQKVQKSTVYYPQHIFSG